MNDEHLNATHRREIQIRNVLSDCGVSFRNAALRSNSARFFPAAISNKPIALDLARSNVLCAHSRARVRVCTRLSLSGIILNGAF